MRIYEGRKEFVLNWFRKQGRNDIRYTSANLSSGTMIPIIVIAYWIGEELNWTPESIKYIQGIKDFYGYTEIENKPVNAPV